MIASYTYDALSSRVSARYGNGTTAEYYYDMADRLLALDNQVGSGNLSYDYSYNNVGNRLTMLVNGTDLHSYTYDNIYQLTEVDYPEDSFTDDTSFIYDPAGNRWQVTGGLAVELEIGYPEHILHALAGRGHAAQLSFERGRFGRGQIIWRLEEGFLVGGSDPRSDGAAVGW